MNCGSRESPQLFNIEYETGFATGIQIRDNIMIENKLDSTSNINVLIYYKMKIN